MLCGCQMMRSVGIAGFWLGLWVWCSPSVAETGRPWAVIMDEELALYRTVLTGIAVEAPAAVTEYSLGGDASRGKDVVAAALNEKPAVLIAVGPKSANAARTFAPETPLVYCMVPRPENYRLSGPKVAGVRLEATYPVQLDAIKRLMPDVKRVAVLFDPSRSKPTLLAAKRAADAAGLALLPVEVQAPSEAAAALQRVAGDAQALWMVSDPTVLNLQTFEVMLAFAAEQRVPFFALNAGFVERGALFAFGVDYARLGRQVGQLAGRVVAGEVGQGPLAVEEAVVAINVSSAAALADSPAFMARVVQYAADLKHSIRPYP